MAVTNRGLLIVLEGIDGSGTTTQAALLAEQLTSAGHLVVKTCEPTPGPVGVMIRSVLEKQLQRDGAPAELHAETMALLFAADRADHVLHQILPALEDGAIVICDRYDLSSLIYQSATARPGSLSASVEWLRRINQTAHRPDLTFVLEISADLALERRQERGGPEELYEKIELQRQLSALYASSQDLLPEDSFVMIDAAQSVQAIHKIIAAQVAELLN